MKEGKQILEKVLCVLNSSHIQEKCDICVRACTEKDVVTLCVILEVVMCKCTYTYLNE